MQIYLLTLSINFEKLFIVLVLYFILLLYNEQNNNNHFHFASEGKQKERRKGGLTRIIEHMNAILLLAILSIISTRLKRKYVNCVRSSFAYIELLHIR